MIWLSSLPVGTLVVGWLALALLVAVVARLAIRALVPAAEHDQVQLNASPLMPALGAAFAIFAALMDQACHEGAPSDSGRPALGTGEPEGVACTPA